MASSTCATAAWTIRSRMVGIPKARRPVFPFGIRAADRFGSVAAVRQVLSQIRQQFGANLLSGLSIDARRATARVLPNTLGCCRKNPSLTDQPVQPTEPLGWTGSSESAEMFKLAEWVSH